MLWKFIGRLVVATVAISSLALPAMAASTLSPDEITATFGNGKPFASASPGGARFTLVLSPDGTASRAPKGSKTATAGKWRVSDVGYCSTWGKSTENCYTIQKGDKAYTVRDSTGKTVARWTLGN
jgi:hypothetical protein